mmetsp:Transcript_50575/g.144552  ORF Transcript_50575/g.144552 Transcript_50575/m.144552 type:complete len:319 (+) Transcript_50575:350-1306(+)
MGAFLGPPVAVTVAGGGGVGRSRASPAGARPAPSAPRPDRELGPREPEGPAGSGRPVVRAELHGHAVADGGGVEAPAGRADLHLRGRVDPRVAPDAAELQQLLADVRAAHVVVVEDAGHARVRQDEGVRAEHLVVVAKCTPDNRKLIRVVVVDERHRPCWITSNDATKATIVVQFREVVAVHTPLQGVVEREVVDSHATLALTNIVVQSVGVSVPVLSDRIWRTSCFNIVTLEMRGIPLHKVEPEGSEAHLIHHVSNEGVDVLADLRVRVVHAGRVLCRLPRHGRAGPARHSGAVTADGPALPVRGLELQPPARGILL